MVNEALYTNVDGRAELDRDGAGLVVGQRAAASSFPPPVKIPGLDEATTNDMASCPPLFKTVKFCAAEQPPAVVSG